MTPTDLLIIGGSGFVGARTAQAAQCAGRSAACTYLHRPVPPGIPAYQFSAGDQAALRACLAATQPRAVIYCAIAWALDSEAEQMRVSAQGARDLIAALSSTAPDARLVYVSTNAVFSGQHGPYLESDLPDSDARTDLYRFYGMGRRAGEQLCLAEWPKTLVARTANVDGRDAWGQINPRLMSLIQPLRAGQALTRYSDRAISPTLVDNLAGALVEISQPDFALPEENKRVLHLAGSETVTDYQYAQRLAARLGCPPEQVQANHYLPAGSTGRYNISLDVGWTQSLLSTRLVGVDEMLDTIFRE